MVPLPSGTLEEEIACIAQHVNKAVLKAAAGGDGDDGGSGSFSSSSSDASSSNEVRIGIPVTRMILHQILEVVRLLNANPRV